jgi:hypothetical protein
MHWALTFCQGTVASNVSVVRAPFASRFLTKLMSGETVAEFMYSRSRRSTSTSLPESMSRSDVR